MPTTRAQAAFDVCWEVYASIRGDLEGIATLDPTKPASDHVWRPHPGPRAGEYIADFGIACKRSLGSPDLASRLVLCNLYYLGLTPYENARHFLGLREDVWASWTEEIRERAGREVMRRGLFPIRQYFGERTRPRRKYEQSVAGRATCRENG